MPLPNTEVKFFASTMSGAPTLNGNAGTFIGVLDACLVTGFGSVTLNSLVVADDVATGTVSTGHGFAMVGATGMVIRIEGATPAGLNGDWRIASVPGSTTFTFATTGITDQTATGTITAKRAPAGWEKAYSGTNKAVYRSLDLQGTRLYLRVLDDDSTNNNAVIKGYVTMSDVDTGTEAFPAAACYFYKIDTVRTSAPWWCYADSRAFYLISRANSNEIISGAMFFGDIAQVIRLNPEHACGIIGSSTANTTSINDTNHNYSNGAALARSYTGAAGATYFFRPNHPKFNTLAATCPVNNGLVIAPVEAWEAAALPVGFLPGAYRPLNLGSGLSDGAIYDGIPELPGRTLRVQEALNEKWVFDLTGPWR